MSLREHVRDDDVDAAICWHPATFNSVNIPESLANTRIDFTFYLGSAAYRGKQIKALMRSQNEAY